MDLDDLTPGPTGPTVFEGRFVDTAVAAGDELHVRVPWLDGRRTGVPVEWAPYPGASGPVLPQEGDPAWIVEAIAATGDANRWVVLLWHPAS